MNREGIIKELSFKAIRSSGAGGQHVNKVSSKIVLFFNLKHSDSLTNDEKEVLLSSLNSKLNTEGTLIINCDETRSQHKNKEIAIARFLSVIKNGLRVQKPRKATKVPKSEIRKRLETKKRISDKKSNRRKPDIESSQ